MIEDGKRRAAIVPLSTGCAAAVTGCALYHSAATDPGWTTTLLAVLFVALVVAFLSLVLPNPLWQGGP